MKEQQKELGETVELGGFHPRLVDATPLSQDLVLSGFRRAFKGVVLKVRERKYQIVEVFYAKDNATVLGNLVEVAPLREENDSSA